MSMPAPVYSLTTDAPQEAVDFLRRLSSMLTGGRNAEMLQEAAGLIETLSRRAAAAEQLCGEQQEENARNLELREVAELASDNLMAENESLKHQSAAEAEALRGEMASLKEQFAAEFAALQEKSANEKVQLAAEIALLTTRLDDARRQAEIDRNWFAEEALRAQAAAELAQEQHAAVHAELEELRKPPPPEALDDTIAVVPVQSLQLARTQFDYLARGFAGNGDVVSQTICEIGARAIDKALASNAPSKDKMPFVI
jgi:DNA repair exonuclease SbcCD ATPase subunit